MHRTIALMTLIFSMASDAEARGKNWCDEALKCYALVQNATSLAKSMRDDGYGVKWDTVKELDYLLKYVNLDTFIGCENIVGVDFEDAAERKWDRTLTQIKLEGKQPTLNHLIVGSRYCSRKHFGLQW